MTWAAAAVVLLPVLALATTELTGVTHLFRDQQAAPSPMQPGPDSEGWVQLFNGKDLTGWEGNPKIWSVEEGVITAKTGNEGDTKLKHNTFLIWKGGVVSDFEITFQYKIMGVGANSGLQYRSKEQKPGASGNIVGGYQADFEAGKTYSGILYEEKGRGILALRGEKTELVSKEKDPAKPKSADWEKKVTGSVGKSDEIQGAIKNEDWNTYRVVAKGNHLQHFINGVQTVDVTDKDAAHAAKEGILAFQAHAGPAMTVQFKDIVLKTE